MNQHTHGEIDKNKNIHQKVANDTRFRQTTVCLPKSYKIQTQGEKSTGMFVFIFGFFPQQIPFKIDDTLPRYKTSVDPH